MPGTQQGPAPLERLRLLVLLSPSMCIAVCPLGLGDERGSPGSGSGPAPGSLGGTTTVTWDLRSVHILNPPHAPGPASAPSLHSGWTRQLLLSPSSASSPRLRRDPDKAGSGDGSSPPGDPLLTDVTRQPRWGGIAGLQTPRVSRTLSWLVPQQGWGSARFPDAPRRGAEKELCSLPVPSLPRAVEQERREQHVSRRFPQEPRASNCPPPGPGGAATVPADL